MSYTAIILAAGSGSRLGHLTDEQPKCMLPFHGVPFLELLISKLFRERCEKVIVVVGYHAHIIEEYIKHSALSSLDISTVHQRGGEGTLPALLSGLTQTEWCDDIVCINADTILDINYGLVAEQHHLSGCDATLVTTELSDVPNYGAIEIDTADRVISFREGQDFQPSSLGDYRCVSNCGCYCFGVNAIFSLAALSGGSSLEREGIPHLIRNWSVGSHSSGLNLFLDFGTPERLHEALSISRNVIEKIYHLR